MTVLFCMQDGKGLNRGTESGDEEGQMNVRAISEEESIALGT